MEWIGNDLGYRDPSRGLCPAIERVSGSGRAEDSAVEEEFFSQAALVVSGAQKPVVHLGRGVEVVRASL
jgi:hypothetical protein